MLQAQIKAIRYQVRDLLSTLTGKPVKGHGEFSRRIKKRARLFWQSPDAQIVKNTIMHAHDPLEKWQDVENWQRKLSNKYNSREFAKKFGCRVAELYWKGQDLDTIPFDQLPSHFVIRPTIGHGSALVFLMADGVNLMDKQSYSPLQIKATLAKVIENNGQAEFLIEEFIKTEAGEHQILNDFKFYMFNGEVASVQVINRLGSSKGFTNFYDEHWNQMNTLTTFYPKGKYQQPPICFPEMLEYARILSKAYGIFVRIDFYASNQGAVFGEFTPTPNFGNYFTPAGDKMLVEYWNRFCPGMI
jgi:hypothetical protein